MNGLLFGCTVGLMLGGSVYLLLGRRRIDRGVAGVAVAGGVGVLAAAVGAWAILAVDGMLIVGLLIATLRVGHSNSPAIASDDVSRTLDTATPSDNSSSPLRKTFSSLISAAIGGILLSVVWSNPIWRIKGVAKREFDRPGIGIALILLIVMLILLLSFTAERRRNDEARTSRET